MTEENKQPQSNPAVPPQKSSPAADPFGNLWSFNYKRGQALVSGIVQARDERTAFQVVQAWCQKNGFRPAARVTKMIVADESILQTPAEKGAA